MKRYKKIILILLLIIMLTLNATTLATFNPNDYKPDSFGAEDRVRTGTIIGNVLATIKGVGICISVIMLTIIGLKYIICSVEEKATYKENMIPYVVGCFLLASATSIPSLVYNMISNWE